MVPIVTYGCGTWSVTLREERTLRAFGERAGDCRRLHNEELQNWCGSSNIIRVMKLRGMGWGGHTDERDEKCIQYFGWIT
jgi:hypothetical protein